MKVLERMLMKVLERMLMKMLERMAVRNYYHDVVKNIEKSEEYIMIMEGLKRITSGSLREPLPFGPEALSGGRC